MLKLGCGAAIFNIARRSGRSTGVSLVVVAFVGLIAPSGHAAEVIPPKPAGYFNDYASVVSKEAALRFNEQLAQFERETSDQVVVVVFPKMQSDSSIEDYTQRVAQAWGVGQKEQRNGVVLFVFKDDRKMFIQVGYGLEGALPDVTAFDITEYHIKPQFRNNNYEGGLATGIDRSAKRSVASTRAAAKPTSKNTEAQAAHSGFCCFSSFSSFFSSLRAVERRPRLRLFELWRAIHRRMVERWRRWVIRRWWIQRL